jgi:hypothetical protein
MGNCFLRELYSIEDHPGLLFLSTRVRDKNIYQPCLCFSVSHLVGQKIKNLPSLVRQKLGLLWFPSVGPDILLHILGFTLDLPPFFPPSLLSSFLRTFI